MKTLLITGGTGFIGREVCRQALASGYRVRVLSRNPDKAKRLLPGVSTFSAIDQAFTEPVDILINLAGAPLISRWTARRKQVIFDSRVGLTEQLVVAACAGHSPRTVISGSAVGFYGPHGDVALDESSPGSTASRTASVRRGSGQRARLVIKVPGWSGCVRGWSLIGAEVFCSVCCHLFAWA